MKEARSSMFATPSAGRNCVPGGYVRCSWLPHHISINAGSPQFGAFVARPVQHAVVKDHVVPGYAYIVGLMLQWLPWAVAVLRHAVAISVPGICWTLLSEAGTLLSEAGRLAGRQLEMLV